MGLATIYFHGMPGSPAELSLFPLGGVANWTATDRGLLPADLSAPERFQVLADLVQTNARGAPVRLIGFSLGAYVALEVASRLPSLPLSLELISAAAPLQAGNYLSRMAGKSVFSLAARHPLLFDGLARVQSVGSKLLPERLASALFASAQGEDAALCRDPVFRRRMSGILKDSLVTGRRNYVTEVRAYVKDWSNILRAIRHPVTLWYGDEDNWAPPEMAAALSRLLPNVVRCHNLPGLSHYSTLRSVLGSSELF